MEVFLLGTTFATALGKSLSVIVFAAPLVAMLPPQAAPTTPAAASKSAVEITLERKTANGVAQPIAADHVFEPGDILRFRIKSDYDGYLYVLDQGSSGRFSTVFPSATAGADNRVARGHSYLIPATDDGWFQVSGPAGFDVLYFLLSPGPITPPTTASFTAPGPASSLMPRCNDAIFRARGECTDVSAGPAPVPHDAPLPAPIAHIAGSASRDITVVKNQDSVTVGSTAGKAAPVILTFRLAHH